ncbi:unnamed protein product [Arabis nemorensis]|uniref:Mitochondrial import inner membrane translocase subunit TIM50 n=1 Tax=Arabis nemorensis TaxID=586526 RepID=A0A565BJT8_9BRAS|nr:unnamed protein product [Arabis nemorensis]
MTENAKVETEAKIEETKKISRNETKKKSDKLEEDAPVRVPISCGKEIISFVKAETNVTSLGLDGSITDWDLVPDETKKRVMESMFNKLYAMKMELCSKRIGLASEFVNVILKPDNASSSSQNVPVLSQNKTVVDVNKETCVASGSGSQKGEDCSIVVEEEHVVCVEPLDSTERKIEQVSALSITDGKHIDPKESQDLEMQEKEAGVVLCDGANTENEIDASVTVAATVKDDSCVRIDEGNRSNPSVSRKKLLVLDLNGLLANIVSSFPGCKADIVIGRRAIYKRPFYEEFLEFCFEKFEVGVWSSRTQYNVERITNFLLGDMKRKLLFCWDMSYCATTTTGSLENKHKSVVFKELNQLWEKHDSELPWKKGEYNETNTVLLDDSPYKALLNPSYTAIFPHSYDHHNKSDASLGSNGDLRLHLEKLAEAENVQEFIKKNPFGQEAITEASESWEFYRGAIAQVRH